MESFIGIVLSANKARNHNSIVDVLGHTNLDIHLGNRHAVEVLLHTITDGL